MAVQRWGMTLKIGENRGSGVKRYSYDAGNRWVFDDTRTFGKYTFWARMGGGWRIMICRRRNAVSRRV